MTAVGYPNLDVRQLVELRALRIDADYVRKVAAHGFHNLSVQKLVQVKAMDVIYVHRSGGANPYALVVR